VPRATFWNDPTVLGFKVDTNALLIPDATAAQQLLAFSDKVATWVDTHPTSVLPCTTTDTACAQQFVRGFGKRAFRAPLDDAQAAKYDALFAAQPSFAAGVHDVVRAMLVSPYFLFRQELGAPDPQDPALYHLTPYEVATNLSYLVTGSMPDDALLAAADAGALATPDQLDQQVTRMLADARARDAVMHFMDGWLGLDRVLTTVKDQSVYGALDDNLRQSMYAESRALVIDTMFTQHGTLADLLTADHTFLDQRLAGFYGLAANGGGDSVRVSLAPAQRDLGILAHASLMTAFSTSTSSSPVQRGKLVRTRLLCQNLPPPPGNLPTALVPPSGQPQTTRQRFEGHDTVQPCAGCHTMIDPVGFAFEQYDGIGQRRTQENGINVDTSGQILSPDGAAPVPLAGFADLTTYLAASDQVKQCMVRYWSYYAFASVSWAQDGCTQDAIYQQAAAGGFTLESVLRAIVRSPHFTTRVQAS
jgi:Protein of unknown function (DUF1592)/Protein of unknown function (DUF1588)/Protein of unknown function (DUF1595)/Protein of unknown function (DUF1585)